MKTDQLKKLNTMVKEFKKLEESIERLRSQLEMREIDLEKLSRITIPEFLEENTLSEIKLATGEKVIVKDQLKTSLAGKNIYIVFEEMLALEKGDEEKINVLFKDSILVEDELGKVAKMLLAKKIGYTPKKTIHPSTLKKYVAERLAEGKKIPSEIGIFHYKETKIK